MAMKNRTSEQILEKDIAIYKESLKMLGRIIESELKNLDQSELGKIVISKSVKGMCFQVIKDSAIAECSIVHFDNTQQIK